MKKKILIVDDEGEFLEMMLLRFQSEGFLVDVATDGESGIKKAISSPPDVILLDVILPGMDGWQVCRSLKENPDTKKIPVLILTATQPNDYEERAKMLGAARIILKPFDEKELMKTIELAMRSAHGGTEVL
jgi:DNA-binding response OmpR family regulator